MGEKTCDGRSGETEMHAELPFTLACEAILMERHGALPDGREAVEEGDDDLERLVYAYDPGDRGRAPVYYPSRQCWGEQEGKVLICVDSEGFLSIQFEDDGTPAIALQLDCPEELPEVIDFLEQATPENLALQGAETIAPGEWFGEIRKDVFARQNGDEIEFNPKNSTREFFYNRETGLRGTVAMTMLGGEDALLPHLVLTLAEGSSVMAFVDFLERTEEGESMNQALQAGPKAFSEHLRKGSPHSRALTLFLQTRRSMEERMTRFFTEEDEEETGEK